MNASFRDSQQGLSASLRRQLFFLIIAASAGIMLGRIIAVDSVDVYQLERRRWEEIDQKVDARRSELVARGVTGARLETELERIRRALESEARLRRPFLSANDRSRWCTVRALVEPEMRVPGAPYAIDRVIQERLWDTIDMVKHDGHLYSSKPPLFATLVAGEYWLLYHGLGWTLKDNPYQVAWVVLLTFNWLPLIFSFCVLVRLIQRLTENFWAQVFVLVSACFGTYLTTFVVTLNNHLPAAVCAVVGMELALQILQDGRRQAWRFIVLGFVAALGVTFELPSLIAWAILLVVLLAKVPSKTIAYFIPASGVIVAAFFVTNWVAHGSLVVPYGHRSNEGGENWYDFEYERQGRIIQSYWRNPSGVDRGESSVGVYAFHVLVGHHGIFSLTPLWILSVIGLGIGLRGRSFSKWRILWIIITVISVVCVAFYLTRPETDRNYGGMTCCFRWVLWLTPFWLVSMVPVINRLSDSRPGRWVALIALVVSCASAASATWNPWTHPWLYQWLESAGWIRY